MPVIKNKKDKIIELVVKINGWLSIYVSRQKQFEFFFCHLLVEVLTLFSGFRRTEQIKKRWLIKAKQLQSGNILKISRYASQSGLVEEFKFKVFICGDFIDKEFGSGRRRSLSTPTLG